MEYTQAWLRGQPNAGGDFVNEGLRLSDGSGWVAIGDTNIDQAESNNKNEQVKVTKIQSIFSFLLNEISMNRIGWESKLLVVLYGQFILLFCSQLILISAKDPFKLKVCCYF